jgi:hypothetical protein
MLHSDERRMRMGPRDQLLILETASWVLHLHSVVSESRSRRKVEKYIEYHSQAPPKRTSVPFCPQSNTSAFPDTLHYDTYARQNVVNFPETSCRLLLWNPEDLCKRRKFRSRSSSTPVGPYLFQPQYGLARKPLQSFDY